MNRLIRLSWVVLAAGVAGCGGSGAGGGDLDLELPDIIGSAAIVMAPDIGLVIGSNNPDARRAPASTTKMMTALLTVRAIRTGATTLDTIVTVSAEALEGTPGTFVMGLAEGDRISLEDLFHGMLIPSTNDSTHAVAEHIGGTIEDFVVMMNDEVAALGLENTHFLTPSGEPAGCGIDELNVPGCAHNSSARDLATLALRVLADPLLAQIIAKTEYTTTNWERPNRGFLTRTLCATNQLLPSTEHCSTEAFYEGIEGVKTGTTRELDGIVVASAKRGGRRVLAVVLDSAFFPVDGQDRFTDATRLLDFGFANLP